MAHIQTVLGPIAPEDLGITMMHEHLIWDQSIYMKKEKETLPERLFLDGPVTVENSLKTRIYYLHAHKDNIVQRNADEVAEEVSYLKRAGGCSLVDCSCYGIDRDPIIDKEVSEKTGVQIIMSTGYYSKGSCKEVEMLDAKQKEEVFLRELTAGIDKTDIKAGVIGELGISNGFPECEQQTLIAAARAQAQTGAPILIHQAGLERTGHDILDILEDNGANLKKTVLCHCDPLHNDIEYLVRLADRGVSLSFDQFGIECVIGIEGEDRIWLPRDIERIRTISRLCDLGFSRQIVLSQDLSFKSNYVKYGGGGYAHVIENIIPCMQAEGVRENAIQRMLIENPKRILTIEE